MFQAEKVAAIILNYNGGEMLQDCIQSLLDGTLVPRLYLVDNASSDDSLTRCRAHFPKLTVIENQHNLGFAKGMNVGIRRALSDGATYVWLINNDATVERTTLEQLLAFARNHPEHGMWSPAIYALDGETPWFLGGNISYLTMRTTHRTQPIFDKQSVPSEYLTGCALFLSRAVLEKCGLLDERYFLYYEDAAYSRRVIREGFVPTVVFSTRVRHAERSDENPKKTYWLVRSGIIFFRQESPWYWRPWIAPYLFLRKCKNFITLLFAPTPVAREVHRAYTDASREKYA